MVAESNCFLDGFAEQQGLEVRADLQICRKMVVFERRSGARQRSRDGLGFRAQGISGAGSGTFAIRRAGRKRLQFPAFSAIFVPRMRLRGSRIRVGPTKSRRGPGMAHASGCFPAPDSFSGKSAGLATCRPIHLPMNHTGAAIALQLCCGSILHYEFCLRGRCGSMSFELPQSTR